MEVCAAQFRRIDAKGLAEGGGEVSVIGEAVFEGKQVEACGGMFEHALGGIEKPQAFDVLVQGHARVLFEDAAEMIRRKMYGGGNVFQLQGRVDVRVEEGLYLMRLLGMRAEGVVRWLLAVGTSAVGGAQDFTGEGDDFFFEGKRVEGAPIRFEELVLQGLQARSKGDVTAWEQALWMILNIGVVRPNHFGQQGGSDVKDCGRIFTLDEMGNVVRLTHVVKQNMVRVGKKRAMRIPPLIGARPRQDDLKALWDFAFVVVPRAAIIEGVDETASEEGTSARLHFGHVNLTRCKRV